MSKTERTVFISIIVMVFLVITVNAIFVSVRTTEYVVRQHMDSRVAYEWAVQDLQDTIRKLLLLPKTEQEDRTDYWEREITVNQHIDVVGCTSLK